MCSLKLRNEEKFTSLNTLLQTSFSTTNSFSQLSLAVKVRRFWIVTPRQNGMLGFDSLSSYLMQMFETSI